MCSYEASDDVALVCRLAERESLSVETRLQLSAVSSTVSLSHCESV